MNIKYASLFSIFFFAGAHAISVTEQLDAAKKALNDCKASRLRMGFCGSEEKRFTQCKKEFTALHREKMNEGIKQNNNFLQKTIPHAHFWEVKNLEQQHTQTYLITWGHGWIVEGFDGRSNYNFLASKKSAEDFSYEILENQFRPGESNLVEDMLGNKIIWEVAQGKHTAEVIQAKAAIKNIIKQQSEKSAKK